MGLSANQKQEIIKLLSSKIENKLKTYGRETTSMPFLARLVQDNQKIAAYSFIHSIATTLGMSIYEDISVILATETAQKSSRRYKVGGVISSQQKSVIAKIVADLRNGSRLANIGQEVTEVLQAKAENGILQEYDNIANFYMKRDEIEHYTDTISL